MSSNGVSINERTITCVFEGEVHSIQRDHPEAGQILRAIKANAPCSALACMFDKIKAIKYYMGDTVEVRGNTVYANGNPVHSVVADRIREFMAQGLPYEPLLKFIARLEANPSKNSVDQLYKFLEHKDLAITPDGKFLAYKAVKSNWMDKHSGRICNKVGTTLTMPRNKVNDDPTHGCSTGFHVGSLAYVNGFAYGNDRMLIVEVDPADVVSVPDDCSCQKLRCCRYTVTAEFKGELPNVLVKDSSDPYSNDEVAPDCKAYAGWAGAVAPCQCDDGADDFDDGYTAGFNAALAEMMRKAEDLEK